MNDDIFTGDLFDPPNEGRRLRDEGIKKIISHSEDWQDVTLSNLRNFSNDFAGREFSSQQFRLWYLTHNGREPGHFNDWGALWNSANRLGIVTHTGRYVDALMPGSHARKIRVYKGRSFSNQR